MKKLIIIFAALSMLLMCMTACSESGDSEQKPDPKPDPTPGGSDTSDVQSVYDLLDELASEDYSNIKIDIEVATGFATLHSSYDLTNRNVVYRIEKLNTLPSDGNLTDLPSSPKTTVTGYALIENGQVVELDGDSDIDLPSYNELRGSFNFSEGNFTNVVSEGGYFEADVISPSSFFGTYVDMRELKVEIEYTQSALMEITLSYKTSSSTVQTVYEFVN